MSVESDNQSLGFGTREVLARLMEGRGGGLMGAQQIGGMSIRSELDLLEWADLPEEPEGFDAEGEGTQPRPRRDAAPASRGGQPAAAAAAAAAAPPQVRREACCTM